ncbi:cellulose binding domain-containing protein [Spirillospora sp. NPDC029432]|uniref:protein kinase domain-containing protein n=1 Tax=Spirillospora sp. NPDC029432 TaxID=3154599 RepID=UPI00345173B6
MSEIPAEPLGGRYELVAPLGSGGMATVWRAVDRVLDRPVAVKLPRADWPRELTPRLHEEAKAAAALGHPHITGVYDYGEAALPDGARLPYVVMELLDGESLAGRLARGPLPWREAAVLGAQLASALAAAHAAGVVHRDVKPANVLLTPAGVKILDFGIAFAAGGPDGGGPLLGTPAYIAPELLAGAAPAPAADVYSFGVLLREALTGTAPDDVPDAPGELIRLYRGCLADHPEDRPTAAEASAVLRRTAGIPEDVLPGTLAAPPPLPPADRDTSVLADRPGASAAGGREAASGEAVVPADAAERPDAGSGAAGADPAGASRDSGTRILARPVPASRARRPLLVAGGAAGVLCLLGALAMVLAPDRPPEGAAAPGPATTTGTAPAAAGGCAVSYAVVGQWPDGFQAQVRVTNLGDAPVDGWRLAWEFPDGQRVVQLWNGGQTQQGAAVEVSAAGWNRTIPARGTVEFGFLGRQDGGNGVPDRFTLNGRDCRAAG